MNSMMDRFDADERRITHTALALIGLWLVAEFLVLGPASVVMTASNGELIVPALLSERSDAVAMRNYWDH